eukprot:TRINITY_DN3782_c0_g1_i1.p1 TRINITY_DN3782_c0_g1~~TRINITY_DN3782_c0_g1_i1.p1  ORF type:complete len:526 (-),score=11.63 TRINITY_DN3782_c0_g1_i1:413-1990(-)
MSLIYKPDVGTLPDEQWETVYLSSRDASAEVPINFITHPGVHLTQACFANGIYDDVPAQTCISNLLALQFRRFILDLYWDTINRQFTLCPVELPPLAGNASIGVSVDVSALSSLTATTASSTSTTSTSANIPALMARQTLSANSTTPTISTNVTASSTSTMPASIPTTTGALGGVLLELGGYQCSLDLNFGSVLSLLDSFFSNTSDTLSVRLAYLDINLHAAAPFVAPGDPALNVTGQKLPGLDEMVGSQLSSALPRALFTPAQLQDDRSDLGRSWYRNSASRSTDTSYFSEERDASNTNHTPDGWPGEAWLLLTDSRRLLASWGRVDPQMGEYNFQDDSINIFPAGYLHSNPNNVSANSIESIENGCFYHSGDFDLSQDNSSWASVTFNETTSISLSDTIGNLTACGMSSILNLTLSGTVTQDNLAPYRSFAEAAIFGWARGEPKNFSSTSSSEAEDDHRCAVIDSTSGFQGHWRVEIVRVGIELLVVYQDNLTIGFFRHQQYLSQQRPTYVQQEPHFNYRVRD